MGSFFVGKLWRVDMTDEQWDAWASARYLWDVKTARRLRRNFTIAFAIAVAGGIVPGLFLGYAPWGASFQLTLSVVTGWFWLKANRAVREAKLRESAPVPEHMEWYFKTTWLHRQRSADARRSARVAAIKQRAKAVVGR